MFAGSDGAVRSRRVGGQARGRARPPQTTRRRGPLSSAQGDAQVAGKGGHPQGDGDGRPEVELEQHASKAGGQRARALLHLQQDDEVLQGGGAQWSRRRRRRRREADTSERAGAARGSPAASRGMHRRRGTPLPGSPVPRASPLRPAEQTGGPGPASTAAAGRLRMREREETRAAASTAVVRALRAGRHMPPAASPSKQAAGTTAHLPPAPAGPPGWPAARGGSE